MNSPCPKCSFDITEDYDFCPKCGYDFKRAKKNAENINTVVCTDCGEENSAGAKFCSECGSRLGGIKKTAGSRRANPVKISQRADGQNPGSHSAGKNLSAAQIFMIISGVVIAAVIMLIGAGVFSSGGSVKPEAPVVKEQTQGADLSSLQKINDLEKAIGQNPNDSGRIVELANLLFDSGLYDRAVVNYKKYLEMRPDDVNARVDLGICYFNKKDYNSAIAEMEKALKYDPRHIMANFNLGIVNLNAGNVEKAKSWFRKVIEIEPKSEYAEKAEELLKSH